MISKLQKFLFLTVDPFLERTVRILVLVDHSHAFVPDNMSVQRMDIGDQTSS